MRDLRRRSVSQLKGGDKNPGECHIPETVEGKDFSMGGGSGQDCQIIL